MVSAMGWVREMATVMVMELVMVRAKARVTVLAMVKGMVPVQVRHKRQASSRPPLVPGQ